jgi:hypothetical protein
VNRIVMKPVGKAPATTCWNCGAPVDNASGVHAARYIYRSEQPLTAVVEDWIECACGAYQNLRCLNEISVETLGKL